MDKEELREQIWDKLQDSGEARFPFPPHNRIPNFAGANEAAKRLQTLDAWNKADVIKSNPDAPQLPVRRAALRQGKIVYMAVPRLRDEKCFLRLDPTDIEDIDHATTVGGSSEVGIQVDPRGMDDVDLIVSGSVAVNGQGIRVGKGEGYSDLEFAILRRFDLVDSDTTTVTTVHEIQVVDKSVPSCQHDVPIDVILIPARTLEGNQSGKKPTEIDWKQLSEERIEEIPILRKIRNGL